MAGSILTAGAAMAQDYQVNPNEVAPVAPMAPVEPAPAPAYPVYQEHNPLLAPSYPYAWRPQSVFGVGVTAGGGAGNYTNGTTQANTGTPGNWDIRVAVGTRTYVGVEGAYVGAAGSINGLGLAQSNTLVRNGFEGTLRLNLPITAQNGTLLEPYIFGGLGWDHYRLSNQPLFTADINSNGNAMTVPAGGGFNISYKGFMADARFEYRPTFFNTLFTDATNAGLTNWTAGGAIGYEF
jgi:hypothetical protein